MVIRGKVNMRAHATHWALLTFFSDGAVSVPRLPMFLKGRRHHPLWQYCGVVRSALDGNGRVPSAPLDFNSGKGTPGGFCEDNIGSPRGTGFPLTLSI